MISMSDSDAVQPEAAASGEEVYLGFVSWLAQELGAVTEDDVRAAEPTEEPEDGEVVAGELDEERRRLWALLNVTKQAIAQRARQLVIGSVITAAGFQLPPELRLADRRIDLLSRLFWFEARGIHGLINEETVGLRRGFRIVKCPPENPLIEVGGIGMGAFLSGAPFIRISRR